MDQYVPFGKHAFINSVDYPIVLVTFHKQIGDGLPADRNK